MTIAHTAPESLPNPEAELNHQFRLDIGGHELIDPKTNRGVVVGKITQIDAVSETGQPLDCTLYDVHVVDPFVDADPEGYMIVSDYISRMESRMLHDGFDPLTDRKEAQTREDRNKYTKAWTHDPTVEAVSVWRDLVPTAEALNYLTNPWTNSIIANRDGDAVTISPESAMQMRFVDDAVAIRDRAVAMQDIAEAHLGEVRKLASNVRWLSLASGTAEPAIAAAKAASLEHGLTVELTVADYDTKSLKFVRQNAEKYGFEGQVHTVRQNILSETMREELATATGNDALYDVVENMGFEEYLPQNGDELEAKKGQGLPQASEFTKRAFELVKPGGILISGNMVLDRPQLAYVFGIVDWPIINARSEESILRVYKEAGILDDPNAKVEMYRVKNAQTNGHVYNIVKVTKLA